MKLFKLISFALKGLFSAHTLDFRAVVEQSVAMLG